MTVGLLFGSADSQDMVEFDQQQAVYVHSQHDQDAWDKAQVCIDGALISIWPKIEGLKTQQKQHFS